MVSFPNEFARNVATSRTFTRAIKDPPHEIWNVSRWDDGILEITMIYQAPGSTYSQTVSINEQNFGHIGEFRNAIKQALAEAIWLS